MRRFRVVTDRLLSKAATESKPIKLAQRTVKVYLQSVTEITWILLTKPYA